MEVVVLLAAVVGVALIVVPRLQRRKAGAQRSKVASKRFPAAPAVVSPTVASWGSPESDAWDDDLGWEGEDDGAPARDACEQWRATESPMAADAPAAADRWRARDDDEWVEDDDDGLGWEGTDTPAAPRAPVTRSWSPGPAPASSNGHDWSQRPEVVPTESAGSFATASAATAPVTPPPELGRTVRVSDSWEAPIGTEWGVRDGAPPATPAASPAPRRGRRVHPVVLVALYAAVGIGLVVLVSTVLLGSPPDPAKQASSSSGSRAIATPDPAAAAATEASQLAASSDFRRERTNAIRSHAAALAAAQAEARREAKAAAARAKERARDRAAKRKERQAKRERSQPAPNPTPVATPNSGGSYTPPTTYTPPQQSSPPPRRSVCEFCIG